jgi:diketogulonate reductase-like aldo/keto reductase
MTPTHDKLKAIATEKGVTPSQLALAWLLAQKEDISFLGRSAVLTRKPGHIGDYPHSRRFTST